MDPNTLDPKLKATYDRVMGMQTAPGQTPVQAQAQPAQTPPVNAVNPIISTNIPQPGQAVSQTPAAAFTADNLSFQAAIQSPVNAGLPLAGAPGQSVPKQPSSALKILYIIGGIVFFIVYAYVWIKIFKVPLPF